MVEISQLSKPIVKKEKLTPRRNPESSAKKQSSNSKTDLMEVEETKEPPFMTLLNNPIEAVAVG